MKYLIKRILKLDYKRFFTPIPRGIAEKSIKNNQRDKGISEKPRRISKLLNSKINKPTKEKNKPRHFRDER